MTAHDGIDLAELLDLPFDFVRQPDPVSATLRADRRVPLLLLLVEKSRSTGAGWKGLQLLNWIVRDPKHAELILALRSGRDIPNRPVVRFEPALDRAIDLALGLGFLEKTKTRNFKLSQVGKNIIAIVIKANAFVRERDILESLRGKMAQNEVDRLLEWRSQ